MDPLGHFKDLVKLHIDKFPYEEVYRAILEDNEYCPVQLRKLMINIIYHLELNHKTDNHSNHYKMVVASYLKMLTKEKYREQLLNEHLLYIVYLCKLVKEGQLSQSPTAPEGLYM